MLNHFLRKHFVEKFMYFKKRLDLFVNYYFRNYYFIDCMGILYTQQSSIFLN